MVGLPAADIEQLRSPSLAEQQTKKKKKKPINMTALFNKMAQAYTRTGLSHTSDLSLQSSEEDKEEEDEEDEVQKVEHPLDLSCTQRSRTHSFYYPTHNTTYSLSSGPPSTASSSASERSKQHILSPSLSSYTSSASPHESLKDSLPCDQFPPIHPSDHMKTLLSQLASSISASKSAFALLQVSSREICSSMQNSDGGINVVAEKVMAEELQRLSDLHMRLYSVVQQHDFGMEQDGSCDQTSVSNESMGVHSVDAAARQDAMLKSYEGIISRFHDEIRKKDAVTEALKATLAKSMLKGEKLERRMKALAQVNLK